MTAAAAFTPEQLEILESIKIGASSSWILASMAVIFFMQLGFIMVEAGATKRQHWPGILIKNFLDTISGAIAFWLIGFGIAFGPTDSSGFIGTDPN